MKTTVRFGLTILLVAAIAVPAMACAYPLSSLDIRNAFFLGTQNDERSAAVFLEYSHHLPAPKTGPYVSDISLDTPYTQVAELCALAPNDHAQEAEEKYLGKSFDFLIHIEIFPAPVGTAQVPFSGVQVFQSLPDFWSNLKYHLVQDKEIPSKSMHADALYSPGDGVSIVGERVDLVYDATKITADPITVEVDMPDGQHAETTFNLAKLR